jgi:dTDP-4-dehydrorhamnose reductase
VTPERILVVGGTGLVGNALVRAWAHRGVEVTAATYHCHETPHFSQLDMQDEKAVRTIVSKVKPGVVALPAANPFVDYCELHPEETRKVNVEGSLNVLRAAKDIGARLIFFSSDYVFDGKKGDYTETDATNPINEYGRQKATVEEAVLKAGGNLVIRTSGAYGWQWEPKNFVLQVKTKLEAGQPVRVAEGVRYNPTYVENMAEIVAELVAVGADGIFHCVGADRVKRAEFARAVAKAFGVSDAGLEVVPDAAFKAPAKRPAESSLKTDKVRAAIATQPWGIPQSLKHMLLFESDWKNYAKKLPAVKS